MFLRLSRISSIVFGLLLFVTVSTTPYLAHADTSYRYTNTNFFSLPHDAPVGFKQDGLGGFVGHTTSGKLFRQYPIVTSASIRLHRFEIEDAFFYISDRGVFSAANDLVALSMYYTLVG